MRLKLLLPFFLFAFLQNLCAQPPNGSTAPNWTMTDINGTSHTLYNYTSSGKVVVLDFSATWCHFCWNYHNTHAIKDFYNANGPSSGAYTATAFFIETTASNSTGCLYGSGGGGVPFQPCSSSTQGDWVSGTPYPIIDNASQNGPYNITGVPTIVMVCPNNKVYTVGQASKTSLESSMLTFCGVSVNTAAPLSYTSSKTNVNCYGSLTGAITLTPSGAVAPYTYKWSNAATSQNLSNIGAGTYTCTITASNGSSVVTSPIVLTQGNEIISTANATAITCATSGSISLTTSGGSGTYTYLWNNAANTSSLNNITTAGTYNVTVSDALACKKIINNIAVAANNTLPTANIQKPDTITCTKVVCLKATASSSANISYIWTTANGNITSGQNTLTPCINKVGTYALKVTDSSNSCSTTASITVFENKTNPDATLTGKSVLNCYDNVITISAPANINYQYFWATSLGGGTIVGANNLDKIQVTSAGTYTVTVTDTKNGCSSTNTKTITLSNDIPIFTLTKSNDLDCKKPTSMLSTNSSTPNVTFQWSQSSSNPTILVSNPGTYTVTVTNTTNGCTAVKNIDVINVNKIPKVSVKQEINCNAKTANVIITPENNSIYDYEWSLGGVKIPTLNNQKTATLTKEGAYTLTVKDTLNGCFKNESIVIVFPTPPVITLTTTNIKCFGEPSGIAICQINSMYPPYSFLWNTGITTPKADNLGAGNVVVTVTDAKGCQSTTQAVITQPTLLTLSNNVVKNATGTNKNGSIVPTVSGGVAPYSYEWSSNGAIISTKKDLIDVSSGFYDLTVKDANGCIVKKSKIEILSTPTNVSDLEDVLSYVISPNPNQGIFAIEMSLKKASFVKFSLFDVTGKLIEEKTSNGEKIKEQFNITQLPNNIYLLRINVNGKIATERLVKQ